MTPKILTDCLEWIDFPLPSLIRFIMPIGKIHLPFYSTEKIVSEDPHFNADKTKTHWKRYINSFSNKN